MLKLSFQSQSSFITLLSLPGIPLSNACICQTSALCILRNGKKKKKPTRPSPSKNKMKHNPESDDQALKWDRLNKSLQKNDLLLWAKCEISVSQFKAKFFVAEQRQNENMTPYFRATEPLCMNLSKKCTLCLGPKLTRCKERSFMALLLLVIQCCLFHWLVSCVGPIYFSPRDMSKEPRISEGLMYIICFMALFQMVRDLEKMFKQVMRTHQFTMQKHIYPKTQKQLKAEYKTLFHLNRG